MDEADAGKGGFFESLKGIGSSKWLDPESYLEKAADVIRPSQSQWLGKEPGFMDSSAPGQDETLFEIRARP